MKHVEIKYSPTTGVFEVDPKCLPVEALNVKIRWTVRGVDVPPNTTVQFKATDGIAFKPADPPWPWKRPVIEPSDPRKYTVIDENEKGTPGDFHYSVTLAVTDAHGNTTYPTYDPEVKNEGTGVVVTRA